MVYIKAEKDLFCGLKSKKVKNLDYHEKNKSSSRKLENE